MAEKTYQQYLGDVSARYSKLSEDEKDVVRSIRGTPQGLVLSKILGTDMALANLGTKKTPRTTPKRRGLATR